MKFNLKVGDYVTIKSLEWYNYNKGDGNIFFPVNKMIFIPNMSRYCGVTTKIRKIVDNEFYYLECDMYTDRYTWTVDMFDDIKKIRKKKLIKINDNE